MTVVLFAVVPEWTVAEWTSPLKALGVKVTFAPSVTSTHPPFSTIFVAVPLLETYRVPPSLTVVEFAVPPLETIRLPPLLTVVLFAVPL